jgi:glycosyltransferase involved in cell wall biosynthesis
VSGCLANPHPDAVRPAPAWVIVTGDFTQIGGQDKANYALASFLAERGAAVHVVAHRVDEPLASHSAVTVHPVSRPLGSHLLGARNLDRTGRRVARQVERRHPGARVIVNGGNCTFPGVCWVHMVHHAWSPLDPAAPFAMRIKNRVAAWTDRRRESRVLAASRLVVVNSERTRRDVERLGVAPARVHVVHLGSDPKTHAPPTALERSAARAWLGIPERRRLVAFVGALGYERKKGFDILLAAWQRLLAQGSDATLLAAGGGALGFWQREIEAHRLEGTVRLLGHLDRVSELLAAADLLVSPTRYDAYGLNVQEALCRGLPAIVSSHAGVAERYPPELHELLLSDPEDAAGLAQRISAAFEDRERLRPHVDALGARLRAWTWRDMAERMTHLIEGVA